MTGNSYTLPDWWPHPKPYAIMDCLEGMKAIPDSSVDLVLTDPPYGVGIDYGATYDDTEDNWYELMTVVLPEAKRIANMVIMPSCKINRLWWIYKNHPPDWLIAWFKGSPGTAAYVGFNDWEPLLVYGKNKGIQMHDHFLCISQPFDNGHPCPKPVEWARWLVERATKPGDIVLDPFLGSGTTLLACRRTDRVGLGFEINPDYEPIIQERMLEKVPRIESYFDTSGAAPPPLAQRSKP